MSLKSKIAAASAAMVASVGIAAAAPSASAVEYRYDTHYTSGGAWLFANDYDHRKTYLTCGRNKLNQIDFLRLHRKATNIYVVRNCVWDQSRQGYTYTIRYQVKVLKNIR